MLSRKSVWAASVVAVLVLAGWARGGLSATPAALYQMVEESMTNGTAFKNPFTETELRVEVTAPKERKLGERFRWYGFHDGDGKGRHALSGRTGS